MFTALISNSQVRLSATTNTQGLPLHRLSILPSQRSSRHIPYAYLSTSEVSPGIRDNSSFLRVDRNIFGISMQTATISFDSFNTLSGATDDYPC